MNTKSGSLTLSRRGFFGAATGTAAWLAGPPSAAARTEIADGYGPVQLSTAKELNELDTPALLIDVEVLEANLARMARHAKERGIALRPHVKTHKCPILAAMQIELGAIGVCAAKVGEAEVMVDAGINNVLITSPVVTTEKIRRVIDLAKRSPGLQIVVDQARTAGDFDEAARAAGIVLRVLMALDTGTRRTGIALGQPALDLAHAVTRCKGLQMDGLQAYAGHVMHVGGHAERKKRSTDALAACLDTKHLLEKAGYDIGVFSGGGTGTFDIDSEIEGMTDLQVGSYLFMDVQYRAIGDVDSEVFDSFQPSLFVLATAISQPVPELITVDAGYKAFANEPQAKPEFRKLDGMEYFYGGDEHGIVRFTGDARPLRLGDKAELLVSHCDPTVNLYDVFHPYRDGRVEELWPISARGKSQ
ncbi:MAG: DSD1 family PLP-dependent enzyme [Acidobacteria bacterium]|nr:DSD1 family PLP-dependent enzyme [Acidobacteriota bacterium]